MPKNLLAWSCWNYSGKFRFSTENNISEKKNRLSGQLSTSLSVCPWKQLGEELKGMLNPHSERHSGVFHWVLDSLLAPCPGHPREPAEQQQCQGQTRLGPGMGVLAPSSKEGRWGLCWGCLGQQEHAVWFPLAHGQDDCVCPHGYVPFSAPARVAALLYNWELCSNNSFYNLCILLKSRSPPFAGHQWNFSF